MWWSGGEGNVHTSGSPQLCFLRTGNHILNFNTSDRYLHFKEGKAVCPGIVLHKQYSFQTFINGTYLLCLTAATRSGPENIENRLSPLAEEVSSLELAESPWLVDQLLFTVSLQKVKACIRNVSIVLSLHKHRQAGKYYLGTSVIILNLWVSKS